MPEGDQAVRSRRGTGRCSRLRAWLRQNKIFFDTLTPVFVALLTISIGILGYLVSLQSIELTDLQITMGKMQDSPDIIIRIDYLDLLGTGKNAEVLTISNEGGPIKDFDYDIYVFLYLNEFDPGKLGDGPSAQSLVAIGDFYPNHFKQPDLVGDLVSVTNRELKQGQRERISEIIRDASSDRREFYAELRRYVHLDYMDRWGDRHQQLYYVDPFSNRDIDIAKLDGLMRVRDCGLLDIDSATARDLLKLLECVRA